MKTAIPKGTTQAPGREAPPPKTANRQSKSQGKSTRAYLKSPKPNWMDRLLRSLNQVASKDWVPPPYQSLLSTRRKKAPITLH